jgi:hypothetical protein
MVEKDRPMQYAKGNKNPANAEDGVGHAIAHQTDGAHGLVPTFPLPALLFGDVMLD